MQVTNWTAQTAEPPLQCHDRREPPGNLSRHPTEKPSFWCKQPEHPNSPVFQLVWIKRKTTSSLMRSVFKGINGPKVTSLVPARDNAPGKILVQDLHTSAVQLENLLRTSRSWPVCIEKQAMLCHETSNAISESARRANGWTSSSQTVPFCKIYLL